MYSSFLGESKYPMGVTLTLPGEESALGRLGVGVQAFGRLGIRVQTRAIPRPGAGVTLPTQYYIPDSLDIGVLEGWGLTFDQTSQSPWI